MLARKYRLPWRLKLKADYSFSSLFFKAKIWKNSLSHNRFAVIVSKAIDKRAVKRNRIRRFFYSVLGDLFERLKPGCDMLFLATKTVLGKTKKEIYMEIKKTLEKQELLKGQ